jgi:hypothetical protein|tara:strand:+ start:1762 stop:1950 length:189 start_codon:yes stop_codon:yes gene_type:complete
MTEKGNGSVGVIRKGSVIKDQGFVPYNAPKDEPAPDTSKGAATSGKSRGMGDAERGGSFKIC